MYMFTEGRTAPQIGPDALYWVFFHYSNVKLANVFNIYIDREGLDDIGPCEWWAQFRSNPTVSVQSSQ